MKFTLFLALLFPCFASGQSKLKYDIIKETGDTIFYTKEQMVSSSPGTSRGYGRDRQSVIGDHLKTTVMKFKHGFVLRLSIQTGSTNSFSIYSGQAAKLFLSDGTTLTLTCRSDNSAKKSSLGYGSWAFVSYGLPASAMTTLSGNGVGVTSIRVETSRGSFDYPIKEKNRKIIAEQIATFH